MPLERKHRIGILTAGTLALAAGGAGLQQGIIPHWEGVTNRHGNTSVAIHQSFDPRGVITVCHGHTNLDDPNLKPGDVYTIVMCDELLKQDLPKYNKQVARCLPADFMVTDKQHAAILSFDYNVGPGNFCRGSVGRLFRAGRYSDGCRAMGQYVRAAGRELPGLEHRRYDKFYGEIKWCLGDE